MIWLVPLSGAMGGVDRLDEKYVDPWDEDDRYFREWMEEYDESVSSQLRGSSR